MCERLSVLLVVLASVTVAALAFHGLPGLADWLISALPFGAAWRRVWLHSAPSDPWDAGRPAHRRGGRGSELLQASPSFKRGFDAWRPRAPTLIVFEDPRVEEAADLGLVLDAQGWGSSLPRLTGGLWVVDEHNYLSWAERCQLSPARFRPDDRRGLAVLQADFNRLTGQGHPLMAEALLAATSLVGALRHGPAAAAGADTIDLAALLFASLWRAPTVRDGCGGLRAGAVRCGDHSRPGPLRC